MNIMRNIADTYVGATVNDRYYVDRVLGCGGMGFVLAATHKLTGNKVALKMVPDEDGASVDRLLLEARAPAMVQHQNLVEVHDVGFDESKKMYFLVQDLLSGEDLRSRLDRCKRIPWKEAVSLLTPVMDALSAAHEVGVVHRDLKPENLFLSNERGVVVPRVLDFGIARVTSQKNRLTTVGGSLGTPNYMPPESCRGEMDVGPSGDVWSMGVILFECISGVMPFDGDNYNAIMNAIVSTTAPRLDTVVADVPYAIVDVIAKSLRADRTLRFATMGEMMSALLDAASENLTSVRPLPYAPVPAPQAQHPQSTILPPPMPHRVDWKPAVAAVAVFVLVLSALFGVRALATPRTPMVMRAISVFSARPSMVHSLTPAHAVEMAAVRTTAQTHAVTVTPARDTRARRTAATRAVVPVDRGHSPQRPPPHVTTRNQASENVAPRNGAPVFEP